MNRMVLMASAVRGAIALAVMAALMLFAACGGGGRQLTPADLTLVGASPPTTTGPPAASATPPGKLPESAGLGGGVGGGGDNGGAGPPPPIDGNPEVRPGPPQGDYWLRETADPFTTEYEWEDGTILAGNVTPEELQGFINEGVDYFDAQVPDVEVWFDPATGQPREVIAGEVRAYFDESAGEQELRGMFDANGFEVVFSWFEPGQLPETNEHASFQLAFDRNTFTTVDDALAFLTALPYTNDACPNYYHDHYYGTAPPQDEYSHPCYYGPPPW